MSTELKLAQALLAAANMHEGSYDAIAVRQAEAKDPHKLLDYAQFYTLTLRECCYKLDLPELWQPVYLLLYYCWNDSLDWANRVVKSTAGKWISVEAMMPEVDEQVWVRFVYRSTESAAGFAIWNGEDWVIDINDAGDLLTRQVLRKGRGADVAKITHWCRMPALPV